MTTEAFFARRREGSHRFSEKRPRSFVSTLGKIAAAETSKNLHLRDRSIFDFFNNIGAKRTFGERATHKAKRVDDLADWRLE